MKILLKVTVRVALWLADHPDTIKTLIDAIHEAKQKPATAPA